MKIATTTYISPNMVAQAIVTSSASRERSSARSRPSGRRSHERADTLCDALQRELPDARFVKPMGGYFLWVDLPRGTDVDALFEAAAERGVQFVKG